MRFSFLIIALGGASLLVAVSLFSVLYAAWDRKLARIPNAHWSVPYSRLWLAWYKGHGLEFTARNAAHEKYGPVVRVAPNDISVSCVEGGIKTAWGNWDKAGFYTNFKYLSVRPLFSIIEAKPHTVRKKMLAPVYTKSYINNSPEIAEILKILHEDRLLPLLRDRAVEKAGVDALWLSESYFMDAITAYLYGLHNSTNFLQDAKRSQPILEAFKASLGPGVFWLDEFPILATVLAKVGVNLVPSSVYDCIPIYEDFGFRLGKKVRKSQRSKEEEKGLYSKPVVFDFFYEKVSETDISQQDADVLVSAELLDHLHAAYEVSGVLATYLYYELSRNKLIQNELITDLHQIKTAGKSLDSSQLLEDILLETMRIYPPGNGPFPRRCPPEGGQIGGFDIPGGIEVSASPYTLGRNSNVFPDPLKWDPKRWSRATPESRKTMQQWVWVFGTGARACIGKHFADLTMKAMITTIYTNYRTELADPESIDMTPAQGMIALPKGRELKLFFTPL